MYTREVRMVFIFKLKTLHKLQNATAFNLEIDSMNFLQKKVIYVSTDKNTFN